MAGTVTILGCGSSGGVPRVAQGWGACDPAEPRNRRRRCSILIESGSGEGGATTVLVDTSPDLREQLIDAGTTHLDGVIITHEHADHTHGLDDLRPITMQMRRRVNIHTDDVTADILESRFGYCFATPPGGSYPPILSMHRVSQGRPFSIDGKAGRIDFDTFRLRHGDIDVLGLRFNDIAYTPDVSEIPRESIPALEGLDCWIIDALRPTPHPTHFSLQDALDWIERMQPKRAVLTNLHVDLDYRTLERSLPDRIVPAFDGMKICFG